MTAGKRRRVAIIIPGGIGTGPNNIGVPVLERQIMLLAKQFDIVVFSLFKINDDYRPAGFKLISIPQRLFLFKAFALFNAFKKFNSHNRFDVIHGFWVLPSGFLAVILGKYFKIASVVSVLGGDAASLPEIKYGQLRNLIPRNLVRWTIRNSDCVTALTNYLVENLMMNRIVRAGIRILPWGISNSQFTFNPIAVRAPFSLLHVANLSPVKDQLTLLKAFKVISVAIECHLTLIGDGPLAPSLRQWIGENGLSNRITIRPPVPYEDLTRFYHNAMILLHTSLSEGQSEVVTEAMSSGVLVCGTRVGLMYDLPQCCIAVPVRDHLALADEVLKLLTDDERMTLIRKSARDWSHTYNLQWTVNTTRDLYNEMSAIAKRTADT